MMKTKRKGGGNKKKDKIFFDKSVWRQKFSYYCDLLGMSNGCTVQYLLSESVTYRHIYSSINKLRYISWLLFTNWHFPLKTSRQKRTKYICWTNEFRDRELSLKFWVNYIGIVKFASWQTRRGVGLKVVSRDICILCIFMGIRWTFYFKFHAGAICKLLVRFSVAVLSVCSKWLIAKNPPVSRPRCFNPAQTAVLPWQPVHY